MMSRRRFLQWTATPADHWRLEAWSAVDRSWISAFGWPMPMNPSKSASWIRCPVPIRLHPRRSRWQTLRSICSIRKAVCWGARWPFSRPMTPRTRSSRQSGRKFIKEDRVDVLMGTFNGDCALAVSALAAKENKLFMVTGAHIPELSGAACNAHTFVFMPMPACWPMRSCRISQGLRHPLAYDYGIHHRWKIRAQALVDAQAHKVDIVGETVTPFGRRICAGIQCRQRSNPRRSF